MKNVFKTKWAIKGIILIICFVILGWGIISYGFSLEGKNNIGIFHKILFFASKLLWYPMGYFIEVLTRQLHLEITDNVVIAVGFVLNAIFWFFVYCFIISSIKKIKNT